MQPSEYDRSNGDDRGCSGTAKAEQSRTRIMLLGARSITMTPQRLEVENDNMQCPNQGQGHKEREKECSI